METGSFEINNLALPVYDIASCIDKMHGNMIHLLSPFSGPPGDICAQFVYILLYNDSSYTANQRYNCEPVHIVCRLLHTSLWSPSL